MCFPDSDRVRNVAKRLGGLGCGALFSGKPLLLIPLAPCLSVCPSTCHSVGHSDLYLEAETTFACPVFLP